MRSAFAAFTVALTLSGAPAPPDATPSIVSVGPNVQISASMAETMHGEGTIVADPRDARRLLVCSMIRDATIGEAVVAYLSEDGGTRWTRTFESGLDEHGGDPACAYGPDGTAYLTYIPLGAGSALKANLTVFRSDDGGRTWKAAGATRYIDRDSLVVDTTSGRFRGRVYVHGTSFPTTTGGRGRSALALYTSADSGRTFGQRVERMALGRQAVSSPANSVVLSDGRWLTVFAELKAMWETAEAETIDLEGIYPRPPEPENAWLRAIASDDGGDSLKEPVTIGGWHIPNLYSRYTCYASAVAADASDGAFRDRVYAVWPDARFGGTDILLSYSADRGQTWSPPIVINDDRRPMPPAPAPNHLLPAVAVNNAGVVAVTWLDRRDAPDHLSWHARVRVSIDGGETFLPSAVMSEAPSRFDGREHWPPTASATGGGTPVHAGGPLRAQIFAPIHVYIPGDYAGLTAGADGVFHPYWIDNRTGWHQVWTTAVHVGAKAVKNGSEELADLDDLTSSTTLERVSSDYDRPAQRVSMTVRLRNTGSRAIEAPFKIRLIGMESDVAAVEVTGASHAATGAGAVWDVTSYVEGGRLAPGAASRPFTFAFGLHDVRPFVQGRTDKFDFMLVRFFARVLGRGTR
jgi:hypothetical protein